MSGPASLCRDSCPARWIVRVLASSIGKKVQMAITGLLLCGFLVTHLAGSLFLYAGREAFNRYADTLERVPALPLFEAALALLFLLHIATALLVWRQNKGARPVGYARCESRGGMSWGSATMVFSGVLVFAFLVVHVATFKFQDHGGDLYRHVMGWFASRPYALFYAAAMGGLGLHLSHAFWSAFQTLGASHPKYTPFIKGAGITFACIVAAGFAALPLWANFFMTRGCCR